jgi:hypothetical protein
MLVFNIQLRSNKTSLDRGISAVTTALFFRNVETKNFTSLQLGQKDVSSQSIFKYYAVLSLRGRVGKAYNSRAIKASTESGKPAISWVYYIIESRNNLICKGGLKLHRYSSAKRKNNFVFNGEPCLKVP